MEKGTRVKIVDGRSGRGEVGTVFWKGPNKWGEGDRLGVKGDNGETYWVSSTEVEATSAAPAPLPAGPTFAKGDRVSFKQGDAEGTGTVFWIGESRSGPGQRLGIRDDAGEEAVWLDSRFATALADGSPSHREEAMEVGEEIPPEYRTSLDLDEVPSAPLDDSLDAWIPDEDDDDPVPW